MKEDSYITAAAVHTDPDRAEIRCDAVISFDAPDRLAVALALRQKLMEEYPDYTVRITPDTDFSE